VANLVVMLTLMGLSLALALLLWVALLAALIYGGRQVVALWRRPAQKSINPSTLLGGRRRFWAVVLLVVSGLMLTFLYWFPLYPRIVQWRALQTVGSDPLCIQVGAPDTTKNVALEATTYSVVTRWSELSGANMQAPWAEGSGFDPGIHPTFHAVLVVRRAAGTALYNWSYRLMNFVPIDDPYWVADTERLFECSPVRNFFDGLR
jgi:hypothetical protein